MTIAELIQNLQNLVEDENNNIQLDTPVYINADEWGDSPMEFIRDMDDYIVIDYN